MKKTADWLFFTNSVGAEVGVVCDVEVKESLCLSAYLNWGVSESIRNQRVLHKGGGN